MRTRAPEPARPVAARLTGEERAWLQRMAHARGVTMAALIREAIAVSVGDFQEQVDAPWLQRGAGMANSPRL